MTSNSHICLKEAFAEQLAGGLLTERYFNLTDDDRRKMDEQNVTPVTDDVWERYKQQRLVTSLGTKKQVGDRQLYAMVHTNIVQNGQSMVKSCLEVFIEREFPRIEQEYTIQLGENPCIPVFWSK